jgi:hypothetical protein
VRFSSIKTAGRRIMFLESVLARLRASYRDYERIYARQQIPPWEEEFLHFAPDGRVHGYFAPPDDGRRRSVTSEGWCPCWARQNHR